MQYPVIKSVNFVDCINDPAWEHVPAFDYSTLSAINACPRKGLLLYKLNKRAPGKRAMALEAGQACHEVFAAVRLWQLYHHPLINPKIREDLFHFHGVRLFESYRFEEMLGVVDNFDDEYSKLRFCIKALETSGFVEDPDDPKRSYANLENAAMLYVEQYPFDKPHVWVRNYDDPKSDVGIEIPFMCGVEFVLADNTTHRYRFIGKIDGIHTHRLGTDDEHIVVHENKTGMRLNQPWEDSFETTHQVTGYCQATSLFTGKPVNQARILGLQLQVPTGARVHSSEAFKILHVRRDETLVADWATWFLHSGMIYEAWQHNVEESPMYTGACNLYFSTCQFLPFCSTPLAQKADLLETYDEEVWNPLESSGLLEK